MSEEYDRIGIGYAGRRREEPAIRHLILGALGSAESVLNVGAGTGNYEPDDRFVVALDPSREMLSQRISKAPAVRGRAEALPFGDASFDAVMSVLSIHHWNDPEPGLYECRRVAREAAVFLTWDPESPGFWLTDKYFPEIIEQDRKIFPRMKVFGKVLGEVTVNKVPVPAECRDGFFGSFWRRPEKYLDADVRAGMSTFAKVTRLEEGLRELGSDLRSGRWAKEHSELLELASLDIGYRLVQWRR